MKNILITGTSRGIGLELAMQLAEQGHHIIAISRKIAPELARHPKVDYCAIDLADAAQLQQLEIDLHAQYPKIDVVIHNAGAIVNKPFAEITALEFAHVYQVNVLSVAQLNQVVLPLMSQGAHVVTISSMGGIQGSMKFPGLSAYSSSKGAVITLSEVLAEEYKEQGIAFNVLALGAVQTEMLEEAFPGYQAPISPKNMAAYIADFALNGQQWYNGKVLEVSSSTP